VTEGKTGYIVPAENSPALADSIIHFFRQQGKIDFQKNIEQHKKQYSWDRLAEAITAFPEM